MKKSKRIALLALMLALMVIFNFLPIPLPVPLGLMIIPVLLLALVEDFKTTLIAGVFLGVTNLVSWYSIKAGNIMAPVFQNPLVCIFPRLMIGVVSFLVCRGLTKLLVRPKTQDIDGKSAVVNKGQIKTMEYIVSTVSVAMGVLTNTLLVGGMTVLLYNGKMMGGTAIGPEYLLGLFGVNFAVEVVAFSIILPPIVAAIKTLKRK